MQGSTRSLGKRNMFGLQSLLMETVLVFTAFAHYDVVVLLV